MSGAHAAAAIPPENGLASKQNGAPSHAMLPSIPDPTSPVQLAIRLPNGRCIDNFQCRASTTFGDVLVQICGQQRLTLMHHALVGEDEFEEAAEHGVALQQGSECKPTQMVGLSARRHYVLIERSQLALRPDHFRAVRDKKAKAPKVEVTNRVLVHLPQQKRLVVRVSLKETIRKVFDQVCSEKELYPPDFVVSHPESREPLDLERSLEDYGLSELLVERICNSRRGTSFGSQEYIPETASAPGTMASRSKAKAPTKGVAANGRSCSMSKASAGGQLEGATGGVSFTGSSISLSAAGERPKSSKRSRMNAFLTFLRIKKKKKKKDADVESPEDATAALPSFAPSRERSAVLSDGRPVSVFAPPVPPEVAMREAPRYKKRRAPRPPTIAGTATNGLDDRLGSQSASGLSQSVPALPVSGLVAVELDLETPDVETVTTAAPTSVDSQEKAGEGRRQHHSSHDTGFHSAGSNEVDISGERSVPRKKKAPPCPPTPPSLTIVSKPTIVHREAPLEEREEEEEEEKEEEMAPVSGRDSSRVVLDAAPISLDHFEVIPSLTNDREVELTHENDVEIAPPREHEAAIVPTSGRRQELAPSLTADVEMPSASKEDRPHVRTFEVGSKVVLAPKNPWAEVEREASDLEDEERRVVAEIEALAMTSEAEEEAEETPPSVTSEKDSRVVTLEVRVESSSASDFEAEVTSVAEATAEDGGARSLSSSSLEEAFGVQVGSAAAANGSLRPSINTAAMFEGLSCPEAEEEEEEEEEGEGSEAEREATARVRCSVLNFRPEGESEEEALEVKLVPHPDPSTMSVTMRVETAAPRVERRVRSTAEIRISPSEVNGETPLERPASMMTTRCSPAVIDSRSHKSNGQLSADSPSKPMSGASSVKGSMLFRAAEPLPDPVINDLEHQLAQWQGQLEANRQRIVGYEGKEDSLSDSAGGGTLLQQQIELQRALMQQMEKNIQTLKAKRSGTDTSISSRHSLHDDPIDSASDPPNVPASEVAPAIVRQSDHHRQAAKPIFDSRLLELSSQSAAATATAVVTPPIVAPKPQNARAARMAARAERRSESGDAV